MHTANDIQERVITSGKEVLKSQLSARPFVCQSVRQFLRRITLILLVSPPGGRVGNMLAWRTVNPGSIPGRGDT